MLIPSGAFIASLVVSYHALVPSVSVGIPTGPELLHEQASELLAGCGIDPVECEAFLEELLPSEEWQHELFDSGPITDPAGTIED